MKTAIILGSSHSYNNTQALVELVAKQCDAMVFDLNDFNISAYDPSFNNRSDDFFPLVEQLLSYQQLIFATPIYWYSPSAQLKTFLDRITDLLEIAKDQGRGLRGMRTALIATGTDAAPAKCFEEIFSHTFNYLGMAYQGMLYCSCEADKQYLFDAKLQQGAIERFCQSSLTAQSE